MYLGETCHCQRCLRGSALLCTSSAAIVVNIQRGNICNMACYMYVCAVSAAFLTVIALHGCTPSTFMLAAASSVQVTAEDLIDSEEVFGGLGRLASSLPEGLLMSFVRQQK